MEGKISVLVVKILKAFFLAVAIVCSDWLLQCLINIYMYDIWLWLAQICIVDVMTAPIQYNLLLLRQLSDHHGNQYQRGACVSVWNTGRFHVVYLLILVLWHNFFSSFFSSLSTLFCGSLSVQYYRCAILCHSVSVVYNHLSAVLCIWTIVLVLQQLWNSQLYVPTAISTWSFARW